MPVARVEQQAVERHGLEFLAPCFDAGNSERLTSVKRAARYMTCGQTLVRKLMAEGVLSFVKVGHDVRILKADVIRYLWDGWSGRSRATAAQLTTYVLLLLSHLPRNSLLAVIKRCQNLLEHKAAAEAGLGLMQHGKSNGAHGQQLPLTLPSDES